MENNQKRNLAVNEGKAKKAQVSLKMVTDDRIAREAQVSLKKEKVKMAKVHSEAEAVKALRTLLRRDLQCLMVNALMGKSFQV